MEDRKVCTLHFLAPCSQLFRCYIDVAKQQRGQNFELVLNDHPFSVNLVVYITTNSKFSALYCSAASMWHLNRSKTCPVSLKGIPLLLAPSDFQTFHWPWIEEESVSQCLLVKYLRLSTRSIIKQQKFEGKKKKCPPTKLPWSLGNQSEEVVLCVQLLSAQWIRNIDFVHKCISLKI